MLFVPVVSSSGKPLMPCHPARARELVRRGKAIRHFDRGIFFIRLTERSDGVTQDVVVGIDPGSKKEGLTVKSASHTYLNIQADAVTHVKEAKADQSASRRSRRYRQTPCRQPRSNRARGGLPPSTKARWQWKLRLLNWLLRLFPITQAVVEDIKAQTQGKPRWDTTFSPLEVGKQWFYAEVRKLVSLDTFEGSETKQMRDALGLKKTKKKMADLFEAHCVDSWVLANAIVGGHDQPDSIRLLCVSPLKLHRRELHRRQPGIGVLVLRFSAAPKGPKQESPGQRPGDLIRMKIRLALKGRNKILDHKPVLPLQGVAILNTRSDSQGGALGWHVAAPSGRDSRSATSKHRRGAITLRRNPQFGIQARLDRSSFQAWPCLCRWYLGRTNQPPSDGRRQAVVPERETVGCPISGLFNLENAAPPDP